VLRLNPFQGVLQVVELGPARALSADGERWEIQVLCAQPEHTWRSPNRAEPVMRYFRFGGWSPTRGLRRVPVSPILDLDLLLGASSALTTALPQCIEGLPFPRADRFELWLLDAEGLPFALVASTTQEPLGTRTRSEPWAATARSDHGFRSERLLQRGIPVHDGHDPRHHASLLERLVRDSAGRPARSGWFEREADGCGVAVQPESVPEGWEPRRLTADTFPRLLLRETWPEPAQRDLVRDYLDWSAPYLLALPGLGDDLRNRLEHAARARAMEVEALYRLYPRFLNTDLLKAIRVEARMRRTASA
jgi:hypothetical protein